MTEAEIEIEFKYLQRKEYDAYIKRIITTFKMDTKESQRLALTFIDERIAELEEKRQYLLDANYVISRLKDAKADMYKNIITEPEYINDVNIAIQTNNISSMAAAVNGGKDLVTAQNCDVDMDRAKQYNNSISYYSDSKGQDTQLRQMQHSGVLRDGNGESYKPDDRTKEKLLTHINNIEEFIRKAPKWNGGTTYRGIAVTEDLIYLWTETDNEEICMLGMSSWSRDKNTAIHYSKLNQSEQNPKAVLFICEGEQYGTSIEYNSNKEIEREVLCSNKARYKVIRKVTDKDKIWLYVKQIAKY